MPGADESHRCPLCSEVLADVGAVSVALHNVWEFRCSVCGTFWGERREVRPECCTPEQAPKLAAFIRWHNLRGRKPALTYDAAAVPSLGPDVFAATFEQAGRDFPLTVGVRLDRALLNLAAMTGKPGESIELTVQDYPLLFAEDDEVKDYFLEQLAVDGLIEAQLSRGGHELRLTVAGWNRVAALERTSGTGESRQAFVAMWFSPTTEAAYREGIQPAIADTGFEPCKIDLVEHNRKICDEIIAEIRRSRFVVADFTGQRGGVYYEAGHASGHGLPVIRTCHSDDLEKLHFDTRQYNHIVWESPEELRAKLTNRIRATIPGAK